MNLLENMRKVVAISAMFLVSNAGSSSTVTTTAYDNLERLTVTTITGGPMVPASVCNDDTGWSCQRYIAQVCEGNFRKFRWARFYRNWRGEVFCSGACSPGAVGGNMSVTATCAPVWAGASGTLITREGMDREIAP